MLTKLTESYTKENKTEVKDILKTIKENKDFKEMYLFYEEIENKYIEDKETAKLYVEGVSTMLSQLMTKDDLTVFCESLNNKLGDVEIKTNQLYESLDQLTLKDSLSNIENKVIAKKKLVDHLITKKDVNESKQVVYSQNENLLHAVLANNFNILYSNTLSESQQEELKNILSIPSEELESKTIELKESITNQVNTLLNESVVNDSEMISKLNKVKNEVDEMETSRYNYYRLTELKNGLN
jgi:glutamine synthetase adenylyltransferase